MVVDLFAPPVLRPALPLPSRDDRWEPLRAGIINAWQYADQEFLFHRGRLVLQGRNGAGKTKVLELLFPFLLDARNEAHRLSPGGGEDRTWRWNLLEIGKDGVPQRKIGDGIVWLEFGRRAASGAMDFYTIGARLRASIHSHRVSIAYFVTDQRPGEDLLLLEPMTEGSTSRFVPIGRDRLEERIGEHGHVYDQRTPYRAAINEHLFGLRDRFDGLVNLLISLRRPKLSEKLDLDQLATHLRDALPPINDDQVRQMAEALDSLRDDERSLAAMERARDAVDAFLEVYRDYALREARFAADGVRGAQELVRRTSDAVRDAESKDQAAQNLVTGLAGEIAVSTKRLDELDGEIEAHRATPAMIDAQKLVDAEERAAQATEHAGNVAKTASELEDDVTDSATAIADLEAELGTLSKVLEAAASEAAESATAAAMTTAHDVFEARRRSDRDAAARENSIAVTARRRLLGERAGEIAALALLRARRDDAKTRSDEAATNARDERARETGAKETLATARIAIEGSLLDWAAELVELKVDDDDFGAVLGATDGGQRLADAIAPFAQAPRAEIAGAKGRLAGEDEDLVDRARQVAEHRDALLGADVPRPMPVPTRPAERTGRPGAPFYESVDFVETLDPASRTGLEAALEAAGVLDAWVLPEGVLLAADELDAVAIATERLDGPTLCDVLTPTGDRVPREAIDHLLGSIGFGERDAGPWVAADGRYALGPLAGRFAKPEAGFIGAGARELTRRRRLEELDRQVEEIRAARATITTQAEALDERATAIDRELDAVPDDTDLAAARVALELQRAVASRADTTAERAAAAARTLNVAVAEKATSLADSLTALGLAADTIDVAPAQTALSHYQGKVLVLVSAQRDATRAGADVVLRKASHDRLATRAHDARAHATLKDAEAGRLRAAAAELRRIHGSSADEALARFGELQRNRGAVDGAIKAANEALVRAREGRVRTEIALSGAREKAKIALDDRAGASRAFGRFAATPLFALATGAPADGDPRRWVVTTAVETARTIDTAERDSFSTAARITTQKNVHGGFSGLQVDIGAEFALSIDPTTDDNLLLVDAQHGDDRVPIGWLSAFLERTITEQAAQLDSRMRETLTRYLFDGIGEELGERIRESRSLIDRMNAELERCPTASGLRLRLGWDLRSDVPEGASRATDLLLLKPATLHENDRAQIVTFLLERVNAARSQEDATGFADALTDALDYRDWFTFALEEIDPAGRRHKIRARDYRAGSGGEQSVTLHLPLFAAVAAYYTGEARHAPRMFFLDEAFAGIDRPMRGAMMGFLVRFDLDFVFTTPDDLCTYAELDGSAVYQLYRDPEARGVYARRWVWTGAELLDDAALRALDEAAG